MIEQVRELIKKSFPDAKVEVQDLTGGADHLGVLVVSDQFKDLGLLAQHQLVMSVLKEDLKEKIHAVQIKTMTWEKFKQQ